MRNRKIPSILHLYWGGKNKPLSWLRWLTVKTFAMLNPSWRVIVWRPDKPGLDPIWRTNEHNHCSWSGIDWFKRLSEAGPNVEVRVADLSGFPPMSDVHRSDLFRWRLLHTMGGFWSDFDIVYFRPMEEAGLDMNADVLLCWGETEDIKDWQAIGFLAGKPGNRLFKAMEELGLAMAQVPHLGYQDLGTNLLVKFAPARVLESMGDRIDQIPQAVVYPFKSVRSQQGSLWRNKRLLDVQPCTVGVHWFAAQRGSCQKEADWESPKSVLRDPHFGGVKWALAESGMVKIESVIRYSVIMPYMDRPELLHNTLLSYHHWYSGRSDWEVVLALDSKCANPNAAREVASEWLDKGMDITVLEVEARGCYGPSLLFNAGVAKARGVNVVLTSPEVCHDVDVLAGLDRQLEVKDRYVVCACRSMIKAEMARAERVPIPGVREQWVQHGFHRPVMYHFCSALSKKNYLEIGGFDEQYAKGFCFDDDDFRDTVRAAGLQVVQDDLLLTSHQWHPPCDVPDRMSRWRRNKSLYQKKFGPYVFIPSVDIVVEPTPEIDVHDGPTPVTVACVLKSGGDFSPVYVRKLMSMVARNMGNVLFRFVCLTDMELDFCETIGLTDNLPGWWSKVELFREGLFDSDRVVYFDLDTLILDNIGSMAKLNGGFYALRPWNLRNRQNGLCGSGVMSWPNNGNYRFIYEEFSRARHLANPGGDQAWIAQSLARKSMAFAPIQDHVQGIVSYKRQCRAFLPPGARVVCFHGRPRVHQVQDEWVKEAWK